ncbi:MAG: type II toxin-antitoxin system HicB family antitoxin [Pseudorhodobacter sp.]|nr:type II toxin-antitoxin system HicB family antitoxin [Pseudorhodobacter sp.]
MKTTILTYRTIIQKDGKYYHGYVPVLHGCHTQGATIEETQKNLREAITSYLMSMKKHHEPISQEDGFESVETFDLTQLFPEKKFFSYA